MSDTIDTIIPGPKKSLDTGQPLIKQTVMYKRARITVTAPKPKSCVVCGRSGKIDRHHTKYAYSTRDVRKNHQLALENTYPMCFRCHQIADCWRIIMAEPVLAAQVLGKISQSQVKEAAP